MRMTECYTWGVGSGCRILLPHLDSLFAILYCAFCRLAHIRVEVVTDFASRGDGVEAGGDTQPGGGGLGGGHRWQGKGGQER